MNSIVNIAAYRFVELGNLPQRRADLKALCTKLNLKGTILISSEGINLFLAGIRAAIDAFLKSLQEDPKFAGIPVKQSLSDTQPFTRMLVRIKKEIIAFGVEGIDPKRKTSRRLPPKGLKQWLDEHKPVTLLDTRNDYEVHLGTFENAVPVHVDEFRNFPKAAARLPEELKHKTVVTFCTGGIRCEKAAPYLEAAGFTDVYQLDGGILKYFEECGGEHYQGECFVFDQRVALDSELNETESAQCYACLAALTREELDSPKYVPGKSCPYCFKTPEQQRIELVEKRNRAIREVSNPLPGSIPYENRRPIHVSQRFDRMTVIDLLTQLKTIESREEWTEIFEAGRMRLDGRPTSPDQVVRAGQRLEHIRPHTVEPTVNAAIEVLHEDEAIVVLNKPAPLPVHPCGRYNRNTLQSILNLAFHPIKLRPAHRLDANTSGVLVCAKTRRIAALLQPQFESGKVKKRYLAKVRGEPQWEFHQSTVPIGERPTNAGARLTDPDGLSARTLFRVVRKFGTGRSLIEAVPETGRTNQIRVHLWDLGFPVAGDPLYLRDGKIGAQQTLRPEEPPLCLHAAAIEFNHPLSKTAVRFEAPVPGWAETGTL